MVRMETIKIGVIGAGHLGASHIRNLQTIEGVELVGFHDIDKNRANEVSKSSKSKFYESRSELLGLVDAVSIVTPTKTHYEIASDAIRNGLNIFIEKPICYNPDEARKLVELAGSRDCVLQVGHIERFSGAYQAIAHKNLNPMFVECHRLMEFQPRNLDVAVVHDLMIHDIDLVLHMTGTKPIKIDASGVSVITNSVDIANARLTFAGGCVANLTASRISQKGMRKMRIFQSNSYITLDFLNQETHIYGIGDSGMTENGQKISEIKLGDITKEIYLEATNIVEDNPLLAELEAFIRSIRTGEEPPVTGEDGLAALEVASEIISIINEGPTDTN